MNDVINGFDTTRDNLRYYSSSYQPTNMPSGYGNYWFGYVYFNPSLSNIFTQIAYPYDGLHKLVRRYIVSSSTWENWTKLY